MGLVFLENRGQYPEEVYYASSVPNGMIYVTSTGLKFTFCDVPGHEVSLKSRSPRPIDCHSYSVNFQGSSSAYKAYGLSNVGTSFNYLIGQRDNWKSNIQGFRQVVLSDVYPGVSIRIYSEGINMKYDILTREGIDPSIVRMNYKGLDDLSLKNGNLKLVTSIGDLIEDIPSSYQMVNGQKREVESSFLLSENTVSFECRDYIKSVPLVIDPILIFSTFSGATADNWGSTATFDDEGNLYSGGITNHYLEGTFPATDGAFQTEYAGNWDVAITKYDSTGSRPVYSTYLGGAFSEMVQSLVVNSRNELVIMGVTSSVNFPVSESSYDPDFNGGVQAVPLSGVSLENGSDMFITVLSQDGSDIVGSTYLGGSLNDGIMLNGFPLTRNYGDESRGDVFVDDDDNIYLASKTRSEDFPVVNGYQPDFGGGQLDAVAVKFNKNLSGIIWSTYLGGTEFDAAYSIKLNSSDEVVIAGGTTSFDFDASFVNAYADSVDGWVARLDQTSGIDIINGRFMGTDRYDQAYFVDLDGLDNIYLYGQSAGNYPIQGNVYDVGSGQFIHKFSPDLQTSLLSTNFGSTLHSGPDISPTAFLVNECNNIYLSGWGGFINTLPGYGGGSTEGLPVTNDALQPVTSGSDFYLAVLIDDAEKLLYGTFFGGTESKTHVDGGTSRFDKLGIVYHAVCSGCSAGTTNNMSTSDFPTTPGAWSRTNNSDNCNNAAFKFDLSSLKAKIQTNTPELDNPGVSFVCRPDSIVFQNVSTGGRTYEWDFGDGVEMITTGTEDIVHEYLQEGSYTVKLKIIDRTTCVEEDSTKIVVDVYEPNITVEAPDLICEGDQLTMTASGITAVDWYNEEFSKISSNPTVTLFPDTTSTYYVDARYEQCQLLDTLVVEVVRSDGISGSVERQCVDGTLFEFTGEAPDGFTTFWDFGDGTSSEESVVTHQYESIGDYRAIFNVENEFCMFEYPIDLIARDLNIPSVFTPGNEDGKNDFFTINATGTINLSVYNRWGRLVFEDSDYKNDWEAEEVDTGTYYFYVILDEGESCKGWVQVLK